MERTRASTLEGCSSERVDHLISEPSKLERRGLALAFARCFIAALAIVIGLERAIPLLSKDTGPPGLIIVTLGAVNRTDRTVA